MDSSGKAAISTGAASGMGILNEEALNKKVSNINKKRKMKRFIAMILAGVVMLVSMVGCGQKETETAKKKETFDTFVAGFGKVDITPQYEIHLGSHGDAATRISRGVLTGLYALTVAMTDTEGNTMLWITTDLSHGSIGMANLVRDAVEEKYGIPKENVIVGGTHNHSSVAWDYDAESNQQYKEDWLEGVMKSIAAALEDRSAATMEIGRTETEGLNFTRRYVAADGTFLGKDPGSNTAGVTHETEADPEIQMVRFVREEGKDILIAQWQCHACYLSGNKSLDDHYKITAEWPGIMREKVEEELDVHCIYFQGASSNVVDKSKLHGETRTSSFVDHGEKLAQYVIDACNDPATFAAKETGIIQANQTYLSPERSGAWASKDPELNVVSVGDVALVTLPQEMFDSDGVLIKEGSPFAMTLIMGYACSVDGYAAPDWAAAHGGYEVTNGPFKMGTAEMFKTHYLETLQTLYEQQKK